MAIAPTLEALRTYLLADAALSALVGTSIYGLEIPRVSGVLAVTMPAAVLVLRLAGGSGYGDRDYTDLETFRVDLLAYGGTPLAALQINRAAREAMKAMAREDITAHLVLLHSATRSGGPIWTKDPDGDWPMVWESWLVLAASITTA